MNTIRMLWFAAVLLSVQAVAAPPPIETFVRRPEAQDVRISPSGQYLAMTVPLATGKTALVIIDRKSMQLTASLRGRDQDDIGDFVWVNDTRVVATMAVRLGGRDEPIPTGELYGIDVDGKRSTMLFGFRAGEMSTGSNITAREGKRASARLVSVLPNDDKRILISSYDWLTEEGDTPEYGWLDVYSGRFTRKGVVPLRNAMVIADHEGEARLAWADTVDIERKVMLRSGSTDEWKEFTVEGAEGSIMRPLAFARDNRHFYANFSEPQGPDGLYRVDSQQRTRELLYRGAADPLGLIGTRDRKDFFAVITADGIESSHIFDPESPDARLLRAVKASFKGQQALISNFTHDGKAALVHVYSDRNPGDIFLFDIDKMAADHVTSPRHWIDPEKMGSTQPISFKARDGLQIHGYLTVPNGSDGKNLPLVINPHGGPFGVRDLWRFDPEVQLLASRGYAVLRVNFRGSGGYGDAFEVAGYRQWGGTMQDDLTDATRWAIEQGHADPKRICIYGASYGAYAALKGAVKEPDLYQCAIGYVGVYDLRTMLTRGDIIESKRGRNELALMLGTDNDKLRAASPLYHLDRLKARVMIAAGGVDERTPPIHSERLRDELVKRGMKPVWLYKRTEGHGYYEQENLIDLYTQMLALLDKTIGPKRSVAQAPEPQ